MCNKEGFPPGYQNVRDKCEKLWVDAKEIVDKNQVGEDELSAQSVIRLKKKGLLINKQLMCYNPKLFKDQGWCKIDNSNARNPKWGFCSPSCEYHDIMTVNDPDESDEGSVSFKWKVYKN